METFTVALLRGAGNPNCLWLSRFASPPNLICGQNAVATTSGGPKETLNFRREPGKVSRALAPLSQTPPSEKRVFSTLNYLHPDHLGVLEKNAHSYALPQTFII